MSKDKIKKEGDSDTKNHEDEKPTPQRESAIEKYIRELNQAGYEAVRKDEYEKLSNESKGLKYIREDEYERLKQKQIGFLKKLLDTIREFRSIKINNEIGNKFTYITKDEYERLTKTKGFLAKMYDELPRALLNLVVAGIIAICSFGYAKSKLSLKKYVESVVKDELNKPPTPSITTPQK